jgi:tetratricopeptide (TPR) repeat protein
MVVRLEDIHLALLDLKDDRLDVETASRDYAEVFRHNGIDVEALEPAEAAGRIQRRAIRDHLAAVLEDWARVAPAGPLKERLQKIAEDAASEDWRSELRAARTTKDLRELQKLADAVDVSRHSPLALTQLGIAHYRAEDATATISLLRRAQRQYPGDLWITFQLARYLYYSKSPPWDEVVRYFQTALALRGRNLRGGAVPAIHTELGSALAKNGRLDDALASFDEALRLDPDHALAHYNRGVILIQKGRPDEAIPAFRTALHIQPNFVEPHCDLGFVFARRGQLDEAVAEFGAVVRLRPGWAQGHNDLGFLLFQKGRLDEAIAAYDEALRLHRDYAVAHANRGLALQAKGDFRESLTAFREAQKLYPKDAPASQQAAQAVRDAERLIELDGKLPAILAGSTPPAEAAERIELANLCAIKNRPGVAARFFAEAFAAQPALADDLGAGHRYNAARVAARAGCGAGVDEPPLDEQDRARWRRQAVVWLNAHLALLARQLTSGQPDVRSAVRRAVESWQQDPDLAGLRDEAALAKLPEGERTACRQLWAEVAALVKTTGAAP